MKKGFMGMKYIVGAILILIVVLVMLGFGPKNIWNLAMSGLGLGDDIFPVDYTKLNEDALTGFPILVQELEKCKLHDVTNCGCDVDLSSFSETHELSFDGKEIRLFNIQEGNKLLMDKDRLKGFNCYFSGISSDKTLDPLVVNFDGEGAFIDGIGGGFFGFFSSDSHFIHNYPLYKKDSNVCWLTGVVDPIKVKDIPNCERKA